MLNRSDYENCVKQGKIYRKAAKTGMDIKAFSDVYLTNAKKAVASIPPVRAIPKIDPNRAYFIGFTYKQVQILTRKKPYEILSLIPYRVMYEMYDMAYRDIDLTGDYLIQTYCAA